MSTRTHGEDRAHTTSPRLRGDSSQPQQPQTETELASSFASQKGLPSTTPLADELNRRLVDRATPVPVMAAVDTFLQAAEAVSSSSNQGDDGQLLPSSPPAMQTSGGNSLTDDASHTTGHLERDESLGEMVKLAKQQHTHVYTSQNGNLQVQCRLLQPTTSMKDGQSIILLSISEDREDINILVIPTSTLSTAAYRPAPSSPQQSTGGELLMNDESQDDILKLTKLKHTHVYTSRSGSLQIPCRILKPNALMKEDESRILLTAQADQQRHIDILIVSTSELLECTSEADVAQHALRATTFSANADDSSKMSKTTDCANEDTSPNPEIADTHIWKNGEVEIACHIVEDKSTPADHATIMTVQSGIANRIHVPTGQLTPIAPGDNVASRTRMRSALQNNGTAAVNKSKQHKKQELLQGLVAVTPTTYSFNVPSFSLMLGELSCEALESNDYSRNVHAVRIHTRNDAGDKLLASYMDQSTSSDTLISLGHIQAVYEIISDRDEPHHDGLDDLQVFYLCSVSIPANKAHKKKRSPDPKWVAVSRAQL